MTVEQKTFDAERHPNGTRGGTPYTRFDVVPGCSVTLFDDGRVRFTMDPPPGWKVDHKLTDARLPGAKMLELRRE